MNLSYRRLNETTVATIAGRLDAISAPQAEKDLLARLETCGGRLVVDASQLDYISSAGIRVLLMAAKKAGQQPGGRFAIATPTPIVRRILCDSGLDECLGIIDDLATATG